jgi:hypothetical protein
MSHRDGQQNETLVKVRLVTTYYHNRLEWEDGPGSLRNVVSGTSNEYEDLDEMTLAEAESLTKSDLETDYYIEFEEDSADGWDEYSYKLEYLDPATGKWRLAKVLW